LRGEMARKMEAVGGALRNDDEAKLLRFIGEVEVAVFVPQDPARLGT
jgi:hypothetical protein